MSNEELAQHLARIGARGGASTSARKIAAARKNAAKARAARKRLAMERKKEVTTNKER